MSVRKWCGTETKISLPQSTWFGKDAITGYWDPKGNQMRRYKVE